MELRLKRQLRVENRSEKNRKRKKKRQEEFTVHGRDCSKIYQRKQDLAQRTEIGEMKTRKNAIKKE